MRATTASAEELSKHERSIAGIVNDRVSDILRNEFFICFCLRLSFSVLAQSPVDTGDGSAKGGKDTLWQQ